MARTRIFLLTKALHGFTHHKPVARFEFTARHRCSYIESRPRADRYMEWQCTAVYSGPTR